MFDSDYNGRLVFLTRFKLDLTFSFLSEATFPHFSINAFFFRVVCTYSSYLTITPAAELSYLWLSLNVWQLPGYMVS